MLLVVVGCFGLVYSFMCFFISFVTFALYTVAFLKLIWIIDHFVFVVAFGRLLTLLPS